MKTMSDFIMEQEQTTAVNSADNDLQIMESFMKLNAIGAVAECYAEHAAIAKFAENAGVHIFTESSEETHSKVLQAVGNFFKNIWEWLCSLVRGVLHVFHKMALKKCISKLEELQDKGVKKLSGIDTRYMSAVEIIDIIDDFGEVINSKGNNTSEVDKFSESAEGMLEALKADSFTKLEGLKTKITFKTFGQVFKAYFDRWNNFEVGDVTALLKALKKLDEVDIPVRGNKLLKKFEYNKKEHTDKEGNEDKEYTHAVKNAANKLAKLYDAYVDSTTKMAKTLIKAEAKSAKEEEKTKTESYYDDNSDGYYFL